MTIETLSSLRREAAELAKAMAAVDARDLTQEEWDQLKRQISRLVALGARLDAQRRAIAH